MLMNSFMGKDKRLWDDRKNARGTELKNGKMESKRIWQSKLSGIS